MINQRVVLASRPKGAPRLEDFRLESLPVPELADGEVLIGTRYLSLDPYMRMRMSDADSYAEPVRIGDVMYGGTVGQVLASRRGAPSCSASSASKCCTSTTSAAWCDGWAAASRARRALRR